MVKTLFLLYHDLDSPDCPSEKEDLATRETVVRQTEFEQHMACLAQKGCNVLSIQQYMMRRQEGKLTQNDIVLTFDDGHLSNHFLAFPVLRKYGFHATFFIIGSRIGAQYHMGIEALRELAAAGMEIGSHGLTHAYLPQLTRAEVKQELIESKSILEKVVPGEITSFAYPGGHYTSTVLECVRESGYLVGASCIVGRNSTRTDPFLLRRLEMRRGTRSDEFMRAIHPASVMFYQVVGGLKTGVKQMVGLDRYTALRKKMYFLYPFKR